jgi:hypothetical protein
MTYPRSNHRSYKWLLMKKSSGEGAVSGSVNELRIT